MQPASPSQPAISALSIPFVRLDPLELHPTHGGLPTTANGAFWRARSRLTIACRADIVGRIWRIAPSAGVNPHEDRLQSVLFGRAGVPEST